MNGGFFVIQPSLQAFADLSDVASTMNFEPTYGWMEHGHIRDWKDWSFYGASADQGLFYFYYFCYLKEGSGRIVADWNETMVHFYVDKKVSRASSIAKLPPTFRDHASLYLQQLSALVLQHPATFALAHATISRLTGVTDPKNRLCTIVVASLITVPRLLCRPVPAQSLHVRAHGAWAPMYMQKSILPGARYKGRWWRLCWHRAPHVSAEDLSGHERHHRPAVRTNGEVVAGPLRTSLYW